MWWRSSTRLWSLWTRESCRRRSVVRLPEVDVSGIRPAHLPAVDPDAPTGLREGLQAAAGLNHTRQGELPGPTGHVLLSTFHGGHVALCRARFLSPICPIRRFGCCTAGPVRRAAQPPRPQRAFHPRHRLLDALLELY